MIPDRLPVLLVSRNDLDREQLERALADTRWYVLHAHTCDEAAGILASRRVPVIVRDETCCINGCIHAIRCAATGPYPAPLIVAANAPDCRLWEDVIDCGGLEVLAKPFDPPTARKIIEFAYRHWLQGDFKRHWERFDYPE